jgi:hypothetical protein
LHPHHGKQKKTPADGAIFTTRASVADVLYVRVCVFARSANEILLAKLTQYIAIERTHCGGYVIYILLHTEPSIDNLFCASPNIWSLKYAFPIHFSKWG